MTSDLPISYSRRDGAALIGVSVSALDRLIRMGAIQVTRIGGRVVISRAELERIAREGTPRDTSPRA